MTENNRPKVEISKGTVALSQIFIGGMLTAGAVLEAADKTLGYAVVFGVLAAVFILQGLFMHYGELD